MFQFRGIAPVLFHEDDGGGSGGQEPPIEQDPPAQGGQDEPGQEPETFDREYVEKLRRENAAARKRAQEAEARVQGFEDAGKDDRTKLEERATGAEGRAQKAEAEAARLRVALRKGLSETQAKRLVGDDEDALEKDAEELLASFKTDDVPEDDGGRRRPKERLRPGAVPSAEPEETDPDKLAALVPRMH